jgi:hypothetical protein
MFINLSRYNKKLILMSATLIVGTIFLLGTITLSNINAQSAERVTISVDSATYGPLTNVPDANQLKVIVAYQTVDPQLVNTKINGVMEVLAGNGSLVKTSSFPAGFDLTESGRIQFASSFTDPNMQTATANIVLMDLNKTSVISNAVTTNVTLGQVPDASAAEEGDASDPTAEEGDTSDPTAEEGDTSDPTATFFG